MQTKTKGKTTGSVVLRPAHEVLLHAAQEVLNFHAMIPDLTTFRTRVAAGEVAPKEIKEFNNRLTELSDAIDRLKLQMAARSEDFIPEDHLAEVIAACLQAAYTAWSRWGSEIQKFFTNHGTTYEIIRNFLDSKPDANDWRVLEESDEYEGSRVEQISFVDSQRNIILIVAEPFSFPFFE